MIEGLAACFTGLEDPRETRRCDHQLIDILMIAVCAVIACAESWEDIELYGRSKQAWLETFLALPRDCQKFRVRAGIMGPKEKPNGRDCQNFRVGAFTMGAKEALHGTTQATEHPRPTPGPTPGRG